MPTTVVVLAASPDSPRAQGLPSRAVVIAADGGAEHASSLGLDIDLLVGDLDSVSQETLVRARRVERHPVDKDATDLELALITAVQFEPKRILVVGGSAGRLDHLLGTLLLLADDRFAAVTVDAQLGQAAVHVIRGECKLEGQAGELISLFAIEGSADGVDTKGLIYPLSGETLEPGSTRGISNVFADRHAQVTLERGVLLAIRPNGSALVGRPDQPQT